MEMIKNVVGGAVTFAINGRIDTQTFSEFQDTAEKEIENGTKELNFDFKEIEYLSSAGLRALLYLQKKITAIPDAKMTIKNVKQPIMEIFEITGFSNFLTIEADESGN